VYPPNNSSPPSPEKKISARDLALFVILYQCRSQYGSFAILMAFGNSLRKLSINKTLWLVSNFSAILVAVGDSSTLFENVTDIDSIFISGCVFLNRQIINVESIPELRAIETFF